MANTYETRQGDPNGNKKKFAVMGVASVLLIAMVVAVAVGIGSGDDKSEKKGLSTSIKAVHSICEPTDYKLTCCRNLEKASGNTTDPKKLVQVGFEVAINALHGAIRNSSTLREFEKDPMAKQALEICLELLDDAIHDLKVSIEWVETFDVSKIDEYLADLRTWLSATITYQQTCLDGFENITSPSGDKMKHILSLSNQLSSNGLAMVSGLSSIFKELDISGISGGRRLLDDNVVDGFPSWVGNQQRELLAALAPSAAPAPSAIKADIIVAQDGTGQFKTVDEAISNIPKNQNTTFVVYIKAGIYRENVIFSRSLTHVMLIGDGPTQTKITGNLSFAGGVQTYKTATVSASGNYFMARDIGFENSAGAIGHQAVALKVQADMSVFYNCQIDGFQDTLYAHTYRQFYRDCTISGTIDFIFGNAAAVFQDCKMVVRKPLETQQCIVTAQGKNESRQTTGFVLQNCSFVADPDYFPVRFKNIAYLARPWKEYSTTIIMQSQIDDLIDPKGFLPWQGTFGLDTLYYAEYQNRGPGAVTKDRVTWKGIKQLTPEEVVGYTASKFIDGDLWIPATGVPYAAGLMNV